MTARALALLLLAASARPGAAAAKSGLDAGKLESLLKEKGTVVEGQYKVALPQEGLGVVLDGFPITPAMGLTTWAGFSPHGKGVMLMGDLVLLENEVFLAQKAALAAGLSITALHNHFLRESPKVMFMHIGGMGAQEEVGAGVRKVLEAVAAARSARSVSPAAAPQTSLDVPALEKILKVRGRLADGVFKAVVPRPDVKLKEEGAEVDAFMGFNTWMAFQGTDERAAVSGDFAMLEGEVQGVVRALVDGGLEVTAIHNHMIAEKPRVVFLHFWGVAPAAELAKTLRAGLDLLGGRR